MKKAIITAAVTMLIVYACGLTYSYYSNEKFSEQFEKFDADKNGVLNGEEITNESKIYLIQKAKRKTTKQAVIILIPVSIIIGFVGFGVAVLLKKINTIDKNEVNYKKRS